MNNITFFMKQMELIKEESEDTSDLEASDIKEAEQQTGWFS